METESRKSLEARQLPRRKFQFRLLYLLLLFIPVGWISLRNRAFFVDWPLWTPFSIQALEKSRSQGRTVIVYYRDDWWIGFERLQEKELETRRVERELRRFSIVSMLAHRSLESPEICSEMIRVAGSKNLPLVVVYPADKSRAPIVLRGNITEQKVLEAIVQVEGDD